MLTVVSGNPHRRRGAALAESILNALDDGPTLLCLVEDRYGDPAALRPFAGLADRFGEQLQIVVGAELAPEDRWTYGHDVLRELRVAPEQRQLLLTDEGEARNALLLVRRRPVALLELFFAEKGALPHPKESDLAMREWLAARAIDEFLERLPAELRAAPRPPPPDEWQRDRFQLIELD